MASDQIKVTDRKGLYKEGTERCVRMSGWHPSASVELDEFPQERFHYAEIFLRLDKDDKIIESYMPLDIKDSGKIDYYARNIHLGKAETLYEVYQQYFTEDIIRHHKDEKGNRIAEPVREDFEYFEVTAIKNEEFEAIKYNCDIASTRIFAALSKIKMRSDAYLEGSEIDRVSEVDASVHFCKRNRKSQGTRQPQKMPQKGRSGR